MTGENIGGRLADGKKRCFIVSKLVTYRHTEDVQNSLEMLESKRNKTMCVITLTLCPRVCADFWKTLIAPVNWICLVWGEAVTVNEARVTLHAWEEKWVT